MKKNSFIKSLGYAFQGIKTCFIKERNMKIHYLAMIVVTIAGFVYKINRTEWMFCILCFSLVSVSEMINSAIEINTDLTTKNIDERAKNTKDIAAGAVLLASVFSIIIAIMIFSPKIIGN